MPWMYGGYGYGNYGMGGAAAGGAQGGEKRYTGRIKSYNAEKGYGFLDSDEAKQVYGRDVFLHKAHLGDFDVNAIVTFQVEMNKQGMPQARELQASSGKGKGKSKGSKGKDGKDKGDGKGKSKDKKKGKGKDKKADKDEKAGEKADGEGGESEAKEALGE